jgi:hypothetical protein
VLVAKTLFHELGHHIRRAIVPDQNDSETMANLWRDRLFRAGARPGSSR